MNNLQHRIQHLLDQLVADGTERGVQVALYFQGQLVVDAYAGVANINTGEKVTSQTLFPVFSATKGMAATIAHRLVERGLFGYETPIATLWPEFAAHGKEGITVRHALNHTSGLPLVPLDVTPADFNDWDSMCRKIAAMKPISAPGERTEYHAVTFGHIVGEVACRATGKTFPQLWHEELTLPLHLGNEMFCGLPENVSVPVAWLEEPEPPCPEAPAEPTAEAIPFWIWPLSDWMNKPESQRAVVPASTGIMTAHALARHYAALLPSGVEGVELLSPARLQTVLAPQPPTQKRDDNDDGFFLGFAKFNGGFGHPGYGGSLGLANAEEGWAFGFAHNLFTESKSSQLILDEVKAALATAL
ncbi:class A beta-lactamase-related serine hydrolase [bacterium]|nr:MAG: class A beta-lactamase-related serine hydrolase [bacterium]